MVDSSIDRKLKLAADLTIKNGEMLKKFQALAHEWHRDTIRRVADDENQGNYLIEEERLTTCVEKYLRRERGGDIERVDVGVIFRTDGSHLTKLDGCIIAEPKEASSAKKLIAVIEARRHITREMLDREISDLKVHLNEIVKPLTLASTEDRESEMSKCHKQFRRQYATLAEWVDAELELFIGSPRWAKDVEHHDGKTGE